MARPNLWFEVRDPLITKYAECILMNEANYYTYNTYIHSSVSSIADDRASAQFEKCYIKFILWSTEYAHIRLENLNTLAFEYNKVVVSWWQ